MKLATRSFNGCYLQKDPLIISLYVRAGTPERGPIKKRVIVTCSNRIVELTHNAAMIHVLFL